MGAGGVAPLWGSAPAASRHPRAAEKPREKAENERVRAREARRVETIFANQARLRENLNAFKTAIQLFQQLQQQPQQLQPQQGSVP